MIKVKNRLIKVVLVEDHDLVRDFFCEDFSEKNGFQTVGATSDASVVDELCHDLQPELLIMDVCTKGGASGLAALRRLHPLYPDMKIIMMSGFDELSYAPRAKEHGASAFIFKSKNSCFFLEIARRVLKGETYFPEPLKIPVPNGESPFTNREMDILRLLCKKKSRAEIAMMLHISEGTVNKHIERMRKKGEFSSTFDMVVDIVSKGWINPNF